MPKSLYIDTSLAILAGGRSTRIGYDKTKLTRDGIVIAAHIYYQLVDYFNDIFLVTKCDMKFPDFPGRVICDQWEENASMIGIAESLRNAINPWVFIMSADIVFFKYELLKDICLTQREDKNVIVPRINGNYEPLFGLYNKRILSKVINAVKTKSFKIYEHFSDWGCKTIDIDVEDTRSLIFNVNTPDDINYAVNNGWIDPPAY